MFNYSYRNRVVSFPAACIFTLHLKFKASLFIFVAPWLVCRWPLMVISSIFCCVRRKLLIRVLFALSSADDVRPPCIIHIYIKFTLFPRRLSFIHRPNEHHHGAASFIKDVTRKWKDKSTTVHTGAMAAPIVRMYYLRTHDGRVFPIRTQPVEFYFHFIQFNRHRAQPNHGMYKKKKKKLEPK